MPPEPAGSGALTSRRRDSGGLALSLDELIAMQPPRHRGALSPARRFPTGHRPGRRRAPGLDLEDISPYTPGDDVRWIDWRATARTGRVQMKRFLAETHQASILIVDLRPAMMFGTSPRSMAKTACLAAAAIGWQALYRQERVGLATLPFTLDRHGGQQGGIIAPRRGRRHLLKAYATLAERYERACGQLDNGDLAPVLEAASRALAQDDALVLVSDFGDLPTSFDRTSKVLAARHRLRALVVEDIVLEHGLPAGRYPFVDEHGKARLTTLSGDDQTQVIEAQRRKLRVRLVEAGWQPLTAADLVAGKLIAVDGEGAKR